MTPALARYLVRKYGGTFTAARELRERGVDIEEAEIYNSLWGENEADIHNITSAARQSDND